MKEVGTTTGRRPDAESRERLERVERLESYAGLLLLSGTAGWEKEEGPAEEGGAGWPGGLVERSKAGKDLVGVVGVSVKKEGAEGADGAPRSSV